MHYSVRKAGDRWCLHSESTGRRLGCHATKAEAEAQEHVVDSMLHGPAARHVYLRGVIGEIRTAQFQDREHLVLPVIALVEGVIWPSNAPAPELVLADSFSSAPQGWNGRPVFYGHPTQEGRQVSGNIPEILPSAIGMVFNAGVDTKRLKMEAWLDTERIGKAPEGARLLERIHNNETIEVSVGAYVTVAETAGSLNGKKYETIWQSITPDHLALLSENEIGACSVEAGCGTPRIATMHTLTAHGLEFQDEEEVREQPTFKERLFNALSFLQEMTGLGDADLRTALESALNQDKPKDSPLHCMIEAVYPDRVVYSEYGPSPTFDTHYFSISYELGESGAVKLAASRVEVRPTLSYEPVDIVAAKGARHSSSDLKKIQSMHDHSVDLGADCSPKAASEHRCSCHNKGDEMKTREERIAALVANPKSGFAEADKKMLEAASEERLTAFEKAVIKTDEASAAKKTLVDKVIANKALPFTELDRAMLEGADDARLSALAETKEDTASDDAVKAAADAKAIEDRKAVEDKKAADEAAKKPKTIDEYLAEAPEEISTLVRRQRASDDSRRVELITALTGGQKEYTEEELKKMKLEELERLDRALGSVAPKRVDFSGLGGPRKEESKGAPAPIDFNAKLRAARKVS